MASEKRMAERASAGLMFFVAVNAARARIGPQLVIHPCLISLLCLSSELEPLVIDYFFLMLDQAQVNQENRSSHIL